MAPILWRQPATLHDKLNALTLNKLLATSYRHRQLPAPSTHDPATDTHQAIALALERRPDVILMDINLPGMNGKQAQRILRNAPRTAHILVIALTASAMKGDIRHGLAAGFSAT